MVLFGLFPKTCTPGRLTQYRTTFTALGLRLHVNLTWRGRSFRLYVPKRVRGVVQPNIGRKLYDQPSEFSRNERYTVLQMTNFTKPCLSRAFYSCWSWDGQKTQEYLRSSLYGKRFPSPLSLPLPCSACYEDDWGRVSSSETNYCSLHEENMTFFRSVDNKKVPGCSSMWLKTPGSNLLLLLSAKNSLF